MKTKISIYKNMNRDERRRDILRDIIIPIVLGVCSILVTSAADSIAEGANETAQLQALIAKNAEAPTIVLSYGSDDYSIEISILDGRYSNFQTATVLGDR